MGFSYSRSILTGVDVRSQDHGTGATDVEGRCLLRFSTDKDGRFRVLQGNAADRFAQ